MKQVLSSLMICIMIFLGIFANLSYGQSSQLYETSELKVMTEDGHVLNATFFIPRDGESFPGLVLVGGAGVNQREDMISYAEDLVSQGIACLIYDRRPGVTLSRVSFEELSRDALAAYRVLVVQPKIDSERSGLWGHSQGAWVISLAGATSDEPAFLISVSGSGFPSDQTQMWSNRTHLKAKRISTRLIEQLGINLSRMLISAGIYGDTSVDPAEVLPQIRQPLLGLFAEYDRSNPAQQSMAVYQSALLQTNQDYWLKVVPKANHDLQQSSTGFDGVGNPVKDHSSIIRNWIDALPEPGVMIDSAPGEELAVRTVEPLKWFESPWLQLTAIGFIILAASGLAIQALYRRFRSITLNKLRWLPGIIVSLNLLITLGVIITLGWILFTGAKETGPVVLGRPVVWLFLQLLSLGSIGLTLFTFVQAIRHKIERQDLLRRIIPALISTLVFSGLAYYWGLMVV